jgi:SAM-dependent methyltransferase
MQLEPELSPMDSVAATFAVDDYMYFHGDFLTPARSDAETAAVVDLLEMGSAGSMKVLDLACGFGRIANRLAVLGHRVTGIEYHAGFLEMARREAAKMNVLRPRSSGWVDYRQGDMRRLELPQEYDRAIMIFNSFGYFTDEENLQVLRNISAVLEPAGLLGFDIANRDGVLNNFHKDYVTEKDQNLLINRFSFDIRSGRLRNDRIVIRDGVRKDKPFSIRLYSVTELRDLLRAAGLELDRLYGEWDGRPLQLDSPSMVVIARKPA